MKMLVAMECSPKDATFATAFINDSDDDRKLVNKDENSLHSQLYARVWFF